MTGLVLGVLAVVLGIFSIVVTVRAVGEVLDGPTATVVGSDGVAAGPVPLGTTIDVDGLTVTVAKIEQRIDVGKRLTCANVSYANGRDDEAHRNPMDWSLRNGDGASVGSWLYTEDDALDAGTLAPGGTDSGLVCFDMQRGEAAVIECKASLFSDGPDAEWASR